MKITVLNNYEDWTATYLNGLKIDEGHEVDWELVLTKAGLEFDQREHKFGDDSAPDVL